MFDGTRFQRDSDAKGADAMKRNTPKRPKLSDKYPLIDNITADHQESLPRDSLGNLTVPRVDKQAALQKKCAEKCGLATIDELRLKNRVNKYDWFIIERDIEKLLHRRTDLPTTSRGAYPEGLVSYMGGVYLACCQIEGVPPSQNLVQLISGLLKVNEYAAKGANYNSQALWLAQRLRFEFPSITNGELERHIGVDKSTIGRWVVDRKLVPKAP